MARDPTDHPHGWEGQVLGPLLLHVCVAQARSLAHSRSFLLPARAWSPSREVPTASCSCFCTRAVQDPAPLPLLWLLPFSLHGREPGRPSQGPRAHSKSRLISEAKRTPDKLPSS